MSPLAAVRSSAVGRAVGLLLSREMGVLANAIAFNVLLCLFPLVVVVASLSQLLPGAQRASAALLLVLRELIPFGGESLATALNTLTRTAKGLELFSVLLVVWGSSGIFIPMEMALNRAWGGGPARSFAHSRLLAFLMTVLGGALALGSVSLTVLARGHGRQWPLLAAYAAKAAGLALSYVLFFLIYRLVPGVPVGSRVALRAALWAGSAWELAKYLFVMKLARMNLAAFYGPLAFAVSLVLWALVSSLVLVFGALMAPVPRRGGRRRPRGG